MTLEELILTLDKNRNPDRQVSMEAYMRDLFPFFGLQARDRRALAKPFVAEQKKSFKDKQAIDWILIRAMWQAEEREIQYIANDLLTQTYIDCQDLDQLAWLVSHKSWWDTVDQLAVTVGQLVQNCPNHQTSILDWAQDEDLWIRRVAILHQLRYKQETDTDRLRQIIQVNLGSDEFFINKAIGWALREYSKTDSDWVRAFICDHRDQLASLSIREASKYL